MQRLRGSVKRIASEKLEVLERLERAMHIINHLREQAFMERQTMWAGLLRSLNLQENPPTLQEAAPAVTRCAHTHSIPVLSLLSVCTGCSLHCNSVGTLSGDTCR